MIGRNLRVLMAERSVNIQDVADATGLSRTTVSALMHDKSKGVQFDTLKALSRFLEVNVEVLFK